MSLVLAAMLILPGAGAQFRASDAALTLETPAYRCVLDARTGALVRLGTPGAGPLLVGNVDGSFWRLRYRDDTWLTAEEAAREASVEHRWDEGRGVLTLSWHCGKADVSVEMRAEDERLEARATVANLGQQPVLRLYLPNEVAMPKDGLRLFTWPESTGLGLTARWLEPPADDAPSRWADQALADRLMRRLLGFGAEMRDLPGTARPLRITEEGKKLLEEAVAARVTGREVTVVRPPAGDPDVVILETDDGPYLAGFQLGGQGWFAYFAGASDENVAIPVVANLLRSWAVQDEGGKIGLISLRGRAHGGWMAIPVTTWDDSLPGAVGNLELVPLQSPAALRKALADETMAAIFNPYAEHLPADSPEEAEAIVDALRGFVRRGGVWLDAGGYPFYYITKRGGFGRLSGTYPPMFSDFVHLDSDRGQLAVYRTQPAQEVFVPAHLELYGAEFDGGAAAVFSRNFATWVDTGKTWQAPPVVFLLGSDLKTAVLRYADENGFTTKLANKLPAEKRDAFVRSLLIRLGGARAADYLSYLPRLPSPNIIHMTEHLHVGFDKAYPDYLPPRPEFGTMDDLRNLYREGHRLGFLMMPYVNPTWWCDQSPSLAKHGDAVLAVGLDGKTYREAYGYSEPMSRGYSICALHPLVRELDDQCLRDFVDDLGSDILFQDQVGARGWLYDLNPAEPTPYAYTEGMIQIARTDSKHVPLSTERGWDRIMEYEVQFCGVAYAMVPKRGRALWSPGFWEILGDGEWQSSPLALYMGHDKVAFALHDLGHFIDDERALAMALPLGHQLSLAIGVGASEASQRFRWLLWLDTLQKQLAAEYMLQSLDSHRHLSQLAIESMYGPLTVVGSIEQAPVAYGDVVLASPGFYARREDGLLEAGRLVRYAGRDYAADAPFEFVRRRDGEREQWWLYSGGPVLLPAGDARTAAVVAPNGDAPAAIVEEDGGRWAKAQPPIWGVQTPAELADLAPAQWPQAPRYIGVVHMPAGPGPAWADAGADEWVEALRNSPVLSSLLMEVRTLDSPEDVLRACREPRQCFAILNPYGEHFPVRAQDQTHEMLAAVGEYVDHGGLWWETGGYSFFYPCWPVREGGRIVRWERGPGMGGMNSLLGSPDSLADNPPAERLSVTAAGRALLPQGAVDKLGTASAVVNRPLSSEYGGWVLVTGPHGPYLAGYQIEGWGYLFRVGGKGQKELTLPAVEATLAHLFRTPPRDWPRVQAKRVWSVVMAR